MEDPPSENLQDLVPQNLLLAPVQMKHPFAQVSSKFVDIISVDLYAVRIKEDIF
jgi:hypothetical protein